MAAMDHTISLQWASRSSRQLWALSHHGDRDGRAAVAASTTSTWAGNDPQSAPANVPNEFDSPPAPHGKPSTHTMVVVTVLADNLGVDEAKLDNNFVLVHET